MQVFHNKSKIIITCNNRLSPYLQREVEALGYKIIRAFSTGVELEGSINDCYSPNLHLRCASQVLYSIKSFTAENPARLYKEVMEIEWEELIDFTGYFPLAQQLITKLSQRPYSQTLKLRTR